MKILISGASGGIGRELSKCLAEDGHSLILLCHKNALLLDELKSKHPDQIEIITLDLMDEKVWKDLRFEGIDALVNLIGVASSGVSWKLPIQEWQHVFKVNTEIPFRLAQLVISSMRSNGFGRIIFFSSIVAQKGIFGTSAYAASKSALHGLARSMSIELIAKGITVNCIAPGYMNKGMINELSDEFQNEILSQIPSHQLGDVSNIINAAKYLLDKNSDYITGQVLSINGGFQ